LKPETLQLTACIAIAAVITLLTASPVVGLAAGLLLSLLRQRLGWEMPGLYAKILLQIAVIFLGFGLNISIVLAVGLNSIWITLLTIVATMGLGWLIGKLLRVEPEISLLLSSGTAICGGSAIAAVSPAIGASSRNTAVAMAVVFSLNAIALLIFPPLGLVLGLSQEEFGIWSALAIHDTSSVVGAATVYGALATAIATTVKLTRALWILPLSLSLAAIKKTQNNARFPWFLFGFLAAASVASYFPAAIDAWQAFAALGKRLMVTTLFLIGLGLTIGDLKRVGLRPLAAAILLWIIVSVGLLALLQMDAFAHLQTQLR